MVMQQIKQREQIIDADTSDNDCHGTAAEVAEWFEYCKWQKDKVEQAKAERLHLQYDDLDATLSKPPDDVYTTVSEVKEVLDYMVGLVETHERHIWEWRNECAQDFWAPWQKEPPTCNLCDVLSEARRKPGGIVWP